MNVIFLAVGYGTRLTEKTVLKPKPLVEIGNKPIRQYTRKLMGNRQQMAG